jgi:hypothetical protein
MDLKSIALNQKHPEDVGVKLREKLGIVGRG